MIHPAREGASENRVDYFKGSNLLDVARGRNEIEREHGGGESITVYFFKESVFE